MRLTVIAVVGLALAGCDIKKPESLNPERNAQAQAASKMGDVQIENAKRVLALQLDVAKRCNDRGMIPILMNGNVDCKVAGK